MAQITDLTTETTILGADYIPFRKTSVGRDRAILFSDLKLSLSLGTMASATESNYLLTSGSRAGASAGLQTFTSGIVTGIVRPASDSTTAFRVQNAAGSSDLLIVDTTSGQIGIGGTPSVIFDIVKSQNASTAFIVRNSTSNTIARTEFGMIVDTNQYLKAFMLSSGYSSSGLFTASRGLLECSGAGGLYVGASNAVGTFAIFTGGAGNANIKLLVDTVGLMTFTVNNATTNAIDDHIILHNSTGTPAVGFGQALRFQLETDTTANQNAGRLIFKWNNATHATRASTGQLSAFYTTNEHFPITWGANSGGALLSFYDVITPIGRQVLATGTGATVDNIITALQALGLVKQS